MKRLTTISEAINKPQAPKPANETRVSKTWERADAIRSAIGDEEFINNVLVKMSDDDMNDILDSIESDMNA